MLAVTLSLVASLQNPIILPPRETPAPARRVQQASTQPSFAADAALLRRQQLRGREEAVFAQLATRYPDLAQRAADLARTADPDLLWGLAALLQRVGGAEQGDVLLGIALTRPLGVAAVPMMQAIGTLLGDRAEDALARCVLARSAGTRRAAADVLKPMLGAADASMVLDLLERGGSEVRPLALRLLGATPSPAARTALLGALSATDGTVAITACESLIEHGPVHASDLQAIVRRAAIDRAFGYAAVALTRLELTHGAVLLDDAAVPFLRQEIDSHDPFMRVASAVALAQLAYRSDDAEGTRYGDRAIVDGLLLVVAPGAFVPSYSLLHPLASEQLRRFTGRSFVSPGEWASWWEEAKDRFVGLRRAIEVDLDSAGLAVLHCRDPQRVVSIRGERAPEPFQPAPTDEHYVLAAAEMAQLVQRLQDAGFMSPALELQRRKHDAVPRPASLELRVGAVRAFYSAPLRDAWMQRFTADVAAVAARERWQLYFDGNGSFADFWQRERAWLLANPEREARDRRLKDLIVGALPRLPAELRGRALEHLNEIPNLVALLSEHDGLAIVAAVRAGGVVDADAERLLAIALRVDARPVVQAALDAIDALLEHGGRQAMPRMFAVLGPDRVLQCLADPRAHIRVAAMLEVASMKELRAVPALLAACHEADEPSVQHTAIYALGVLRAPEAREVLLAMLSTLAPEARRVALVALGRIGGEGVLAALMQATTMDGEDKRAAISGLGKLDDPAAAEALASLFLVTGPGPLGTLVHAALQEQGPLRARSALRKALDQARDRRVRDEIVHLLADFQDPTVVPDLIEMLDDVRNGPRAAIQLAAITGVDLGKVADRSAAMVEWWARHKSEPQAVWFLNAVRAAGHDTKLTPAQLEPRAGVEAVPELTRLMTETDRPHIRLLALALLRDTTQRDFGSISPQSGTEELIALADRYRFYAESVTTGGK